ncbi:MAG: nicotinate-nucleotide adenylyltransferase [Gammaproteobacteria bacterium]|nr:nicotinate-nucleotide adenylyltransferase [Gammaproteobacteria bacterium]MCB1816866.1 nicotinate-nucleotide adenylyltransferase [Gammaproteobacteria bacterium]MCW5584909.1 nicotinate-nucleotide adenylyltransferase [Chromatiales bacterium]HOP16481.1 nicotinate-nucleotide adenylyltransferase [Gammaproteobacteria bacterium]HPQ26018.1 nicotinate-nucleotide adenylyltransferase [Gammaproteobacteria bacterium]
MDTSGPESTAGDKTAIGVFGGTFDPVHFGHLRIALDALEALDLDHVRLIPLANAVHREQPDTPGALRFQMLQAAVAGRNDLVADDRELRRAGPSYTIDTLRSLRADFPNAHLWLLLGSDAYAGFSSWRDPQGILETANIAVLQRPGNDAHASPAAAGFSTTQAQGQVVFCPVTQLDIASSDIRARIAAGRSADFLAPPAVLALAARHRLYGQPTAHGL